MNEQTGNALSRRDRRRRSDNQASGRKVLKTAARSNRSAGSRRSARRRKQRRQWFRSPVAIGSLAVLAVSLAFIGAKAAGYHRFCTMRDVVESNTFYQGITIDGEDVSQMTLSEALDRWSKKDAAGSGVSIEIEGSEYVITAAEINYSDNYVDVLNNAYAIGRYGTLESRYNDIARASGLWKRDYKVDAEFDEAALKRCINSIATELNRPAVETTIVGFDPNSSSFTFQEGQDGKIVDAESLYDKVVEAFENGGGSVVATLQTVTPAETAETLQEKYGLLSTFTTPIRDDSDNRVNNLQVATSVLNGMCIQPGETFSFNGTLGKRTKDKGYKAAGALENGVHTSQVGGGICQVATTLFNAVALADMEIVERNPHSLPSKYISIGRDATVSWPKQDFKWKNTSDYPIYIRMGVSTHRKKVICEVYGKKRDDGVEVKLTVDRTGTYAPSKKSTYEYTSSLAPGERKVAEKAHKGFSCTTYRVYVDAQTQKILDKVELFKSYYAPGGAVILVGR